MFKIMEGKHVFARRCIIASLFLILFFGGLFPGYQQALANGVTPLVETQWLADNLKNKDIRLVYVGGMAENDEVNFANKHIKGSVYLAIGELMDVMGGSTPPDKVKFEALMSDLGIDKSSHVILHGSGGGNPFITAALWLMDYNNHKKISYLNGGFDKWNQEKRETTGEATKIKPTAYSAEPINESIRADAEYVLKNLKNSKVVIIDTRGADVYKGEVNEVESNKRVGHIPSAVNLNFFTTNLKEDGTFKSIEDLKSVYEAKGVTKDKEVIVYCQGGVRASHTYFVLKHLLDYPRVRVYVGSWGEWSNLDPAKYPVEK